MRCELAGIRMNDSLDGALAQGEEQELLDHLKGCEDCKRTFEELNQLATQTRRLPATLEPDRDLWPEIKARIEGEVEVFSTRRRLLFAGNAIPFALAASAVLAVAFGLLVLTRYSPESSEPVVINDYESIEQEYRNAKAALLATLRSPDSYVSEETLTTIEESLEVIGKAVSDIRLALEVDPNNPHLERMLMATYNAEINLLHQAVRLTGKS